MKTIVLLLSLVLLINRTVFAQAADVPIVPEEGNNVPSAQFRKAMIELYDFGKPLSAQVSAPTERSSGTYMVFRDAVRAADVQALIKPKH